MFSGKSTELIRQIRRYTLSGKRCLVIKFDGDTRYSSHDVHTHDRLTIGAMTFNQLEHAKEFALKYDVIGIDEGQFFDDLVPVCQYWADQHSKTVIVAGLDADFRRDGFPNVLQLIPKSERVSKLSAICKYCGLDAYFSMRLVESQEQQLIGGHESYAPTCRSCHKF